MNKYISGLVSVIIPTYRRCDTLVRAVESVINQTYKNIEIIVVNDNTPGDEFSLMLYDEIKKITDDRFVFLEQEKHINGAAARNCGIKKAKGEYIAFLDDDDYWMPEKLEHQIKAFENLGKEWGVVSSLNLRCKNGDVVLAVPPYKSGYVLQEIMQRTVELSTIAVLIRREALDDTGYFDENLLRYQDIQLFTRLSHKYKVFLLKEYLQIINVDDNQNRPSAERMTAIRNAYYESVRDIIDGLSEKDKKKLFIMHRFEDSAIFLKEKNYRRFVVNFMGILRYPSTFFGSINRLWGRLEGKVFKKYLLKKYSIK